MKAVVSLFFVGLKACLFRVIVFELSDMEKKKKLAKINYTELGFDICRSTYESYAANVSSLCVEFSHLA